MKIIFLKDVPKHGRRGEVKEVSEGFARNFLLPKGLAALATSARLRSRVDQAAADARALVREQARGKRVQAQLKGRTIIMSAKASESGTLYRGVGVGEVTRLLLEQGFHVLESEVELRKPLKQIGEHAVSVRLSGGKFEFTLHIKNL